MIEVKDLTKRYGPKVAVDHLSFQVEPGLVTGFLGPNGAGKSTTMRVILGLDAPTGGQTSIGGKPYGSLSQPLRRVGSLLDGKAMHGGRTAYNHLLWMSQSNGIPRARVDEVLEMVGLSQVASQRTKGFSLGMGQRLGIASALLGDPDVLLLDEPVNGLDTEGIRWIRDLMKGLAAEGRTVLLSSHLMSEMELTADHLVVIGQGRLIADTSMHAFIQHNSQAVTVVRSPEIDKLRMALARVGGRMQLDAKGGWRVSGPDAATIGDVAAAQGVTLHELTPRLSSLEDVYTQMTKSSVEYRGSERTKAQPVTTGREA
ncbi:ABC transporter ATP-binding protein [soil metagenome]